MENKATERPLYLQPRPKIEHDAHEDLYPTKGEILYSLSREINKLELGDIARVQAFVSALVEQKTGKREQRQAKTRKWNANLQPGLGDK